MGGMAETTHIDAYFTGRVQGVGFRYQTARVAQGFDVSGYVQNLPDGRVRLEAEGAGEEIEAFVSAVEEQMTGFIRKKERTVGRRPPQFRGFTIR
jgi:acylphosphatase